MTSITRRSVPPQPMRNVDFDPFRAPTTGASLRRPGKPLLLREVTDYASGLTVYPPRRRCSRWLLIAAAVLFGALLAVGTWVAR